MNVIFCVPPDIASELNDFQVVPLSDCKISTSLGAYELEFPQ